jgi:hypothetical protein
MIYLWIKYPFGAGKFNLGITKIFSILAKEISLFQDGICKYRKGGYPCKAPERNSALARI